MKKQFKTLCTLALALGMSLHLQAQNTTTSVIQVTDDVTLTEPVDYVITGDTPFDNGSIDIQNESAVVIIDKMKPSLAIKQLASHVKINGEKAVNGTNCQVKIHNLGAIILPYGNSFHPLTVYSEQNFEGESVNDFGLEHTGGFMNTLSAAKLNNQIRSFKLKRGYMVTFSTRSGGSGYSRCFIAAYQDLEVPELPAVLDQTISSYRIFKWFDTGKKQLANYANKEACAALNVQSTYDWGQGNNSLAPDVEWVPNHIYEDWPSASTIGSTESESPHTKTNNEPLNESDDHPQSLTTILNNWENLMRTGRRLCTPSSWDGSDYWNATGFLAEFLDSIDARGWRCDIIDLHCYWPESNFGNVKNWANKFKRPIWISEWCWGASWNSNGAFASGVTENQVKDALTRICTNLNGYDCMERYYYWNGERDPSKLYKNGTLTPAGQYYAGMDSGLGYNGLYDFIPKNPRQHNPQGLTITVKAGIATLKWKDNNGEYNQLMEIQRRTQDETFWESIATVELKEVAANYTYNDESPIDQATYRVHIVDLNGKDRYTNEAKVSLPSGSSTIQFGKVILPTVNTAVSTGFTTDFDKNPLVFIGPSTYNNPTTVCTPSFNGSSAVTTSQFSISMMPWTLQSNMNTTFSKAEEVPFLAMPAGNYQFGTMSLELGSIAIKDTTEVMFETPFPEGVTPIVIATVNRMPTVNNGPIMHRIWDVTNTGFKCNVMYEDALVDSRGNKKTPSVNHTVAYLAATPGDQCVDEENDIWFAAGRGDNPIYGNIARNNRFYYDIWTGNELLTDSVPMEEEPFLFADLQTKNTTVPVTLKMNRYIYDNVLDSEGGEHNCIIGASIRRYTDKSVSSSTAVDGFANADDLGWFAIHKKRSFERTPPTPDNPIDPEDPEDPENPEDPQVVAVQNVNAAQDAFTIRVANRIITVNGLRNYQVYTANGVRVAAHTPQTPGVYIVRAAGKVAKVIVQ